MDAESYLHQPPWFDLPVCGLLCSLQTGRARAFCSSLRDFLSRCICLSVLHAGWQLSRSRFGNCFSRQRRAAVFPAVVPALLRPLSIATTTLCDATMACSFAVCAGVCAA